MEFIVTYEPKAPKEEHGNKVYGNFQNNIFKEGKGMLLD